MSFILLFPIHGFSKCKGLRARGFSPVEVLLAATIFGFLVTGIVGAIIYGQVSTASGGDRGRANAIAEEGIEAVRNMRDAAFTNVTGTFGLGKIGGVWAPSGAFDTTDGLYKRTVTINAIDAVRKTVTVDVSWVQGAVTSQTTLTSRMTNWLAAIIPPTSWPNAILKGSYDAASTGDAVKVATVGNYAYVVRSSGTPNFLVVNITNPAAPTLAGSLTLAGTPSNIAVSGNFAYISNSGTATELQIVNVTTPTAPSLSSTYDAVGAAGALGVYAVGTTVYLTRSLSGTTGTNEFVVVNAASPTAPALLGSYNNNITMYGVYVSGNYAYVATSADTAELLVINITTPSSMTQAGFLDLTGTTDANCIIGYGSRVLVGHGNALRAVNVTTPTAPAVLGSVTPTGVGIVNDVVVDATNTYAFIGTSSTAAEFQVINITNPASMAVSRIVDLTGTTSSLNGVGYNTANDLVVGASASDTQEVPIFTKN